ncbi:uncharacterized protein LOC112512045 [Cynara cardunculus var. scolymus]|uniref:Uncharacterized protein n=1 Tax=Cynara cardunculus var. scolymus TaxID=59895 RepID=A0A103Y7E1_CYNCS|nr:uncharacterized protein LOC112512045 [Cynara cardunculus var. scolymus]XP_024973604.1 uncharacterized protein LOC112512045 [Cynara cardunculus var. scolymus]XP_024973605.1 uncharacterized protein LOC112512045 [Cynara cardunculus var. scolymus]XP_024973606.1 uncharacterized protein LOC112512045 [Cynara cardunculus var. scolymus]KVI03893.1 Protein of unknown function DUF506, plant [Cynara cardunculus var. scolymus]
MKIQPIDSTTLEYFEYEKTVPKSRLRRLFDLSIFLKGSAVEDRFVSGELECGEDGLDEIEPTSVCLDKMVENFLEESNGKQSALKCGRHHHCLCFDGNVHRCSESSEDEFDSFSCFGNSINSRDSSLDACSLLKSLVICETISERDLLADSAKIVDKNKICKRKVEINRKVIADCLLAAGYNVSICKSRWEKTRTYPAGEHEYIDAIIEGDRYIIDIDFRSEFEIARSTKSYKAVLQMLPDIFMGKTDRLLKIINIVTDAAKLSMKKKGMPFPPWRRADYVKAKWLSPYTRINKFNASTNTKSDTRFTILTDEKKGPDQNVKQWDPLEIKPKTSKIVGKVIGGLASVIEGNGEN